MQKAVCLFLLFCENHNALRIFPFFLASFGRKKGVFYFVIHRRFMQKLEHDSKSF